MRAIRAFLLLLLALPSIVSAAPRYRLLMQGGVSVPAAPEAFTRLWNTGYGFGLGAERGLSPLIAQWIVVEYSRLMLDGDHASFFTFGPQLGVDGGDASIIGVMMGARVRASARVARPYVDGGLGVQTFKADDVTVRYVDFATGQPAMYTALGVRETKPALSVGTGVEFPEFGGVTLFIDGHWVITFTQDKSSQIVPIRMGLMYP